MDDVRAHGDRVLRGKRSRSIYRLITMAAAMVCLAVALLLIPHEWVESYVLVLLTGFAIPGVLSLFAAAAGFLRFGYREGDNLFGGVAADALGEGIVVTSGHALRVVYANNAYKDMVGVDSRNVPPGIPRFFAPNPEANDAIYRLVQAAREGRQWEEEFRVLPPADEARPRWYKVSVQGLALPLFDGIGDEDSGVLWRVADITHDCSDQENAFQELQHAIDYLDHAPAGFFSTDSEGRIEYLNATLANWLGLDLVQTVARNLTLSDIFVGDTKPLLVFSTPRPGEPYSEIIDLELRHRNGTSCPVRLFHSVSFCSDGSHGYSRTLVIHRHQSDDLARDVFDAEIRFERFFNNAPIAIATVSGDGTIVRANFEFVKMQRQCGTRSGSATRIFDSLSDENRKKVEEVLLLAKEGQVDLQPLDIRFEALPDAFWRLYISSMQGDEPDQAVALVYAIDISTQRVLEMQVVQSQKMQAIGQLAGGVAHDFNNVLTAIIGYSDLLLAAHRATDPAFQDIMNIKQSAQRGASLVRQLLAFSRQQTLQPKVLNLTEDLSDMTTMLRRLVGEKIELEVTHGRDLWAVKVDLTQLEQVIVNLVVNARDAMPDGGKVSLRTSNISAEEVSRAAYPAMPAADYVQIEVSDTGIGMDDHTMAKMFDPFFSTKEVGKGTGLGLSTVYGIIKQTGGFIFPESVLGEGTMFHIFLPRHVPTDTEREVVAIDNAKPMADTTGAGTILLVEDEDAVRSFAARALTMRGYSVLEAGTGTEALEILSAREAKVDLVVSDVVMPEMDGPTLLKELRVLDPDMKVIFMSGYAEEAFRKNLESNARFTFLQKPFNLQDLSATVKSVLEET